MQSLRSLVQLALLPFLLHAAYSRRLISTVIHRDPVLIANKPTKLDIEVLDSFGDVVPWGDLLLSHQRKVHVYAIHQVHSTARTSYQVSSFVAAASFPFQLSLSTPPSLNAVVVVHPLAKDWCRGWNICSTCTQMTLETSLPSRLPFLYG